jgi:hypothetical protein
MDNVIYRGNTEEERLESAIHYTSLMNLIERFRAGQVYCTSKELEALTLAIQVTIPLLAELPQQPVTGPEVAGTGDEQAAGPVPGAPLQPATATPVAPPETGGTQKPVTAKGTRLPRQVM